MILLPAWIATELIQHLMGRQGVAYLAHLGGLVAGVALMGMAIVAGRVRALDVLENTRDKEKLQQQAALRAQLEKARTLTAQMQFEPASRAWREIVKARPTDASVLRAWFNVAQHDPQGAYFHQAAHMIFGLRNRSDATAKLQHDTYQKYLKLARPRVRMPPEVALQLVPRFVQIGQTHDAERLCCVLSKVALRHPDLPNVLELYINSLLHSGQRQQAAAWLSTMQTIAPQSAVTLMLQEG